MVSSENLRNLEAVYQQIAEQASTALDEMGNHAAASTNAIDIAYSNVSTNLGLT
jgi:hypothetical protein